MAVVLWAGLRQLESLRDAMVSNIVSGRFTMQFQGGSFDKLESWIEEEELRLADFLNRNETLDEARSSKIDIRSRLSLGLRQTTINLFGANYGSIVAEGQRTTERIDPDTDHGVERSSASWERSENLLTSSLLLRLMATLEQFEVDSLKALLFYRPRGYGPPSEEYEDEEANEEVVFEDPEVKDQVEMFKYPPLWTWIRSSALDNGQRRRMFSRVYNITFPQPEFGMKHTQLCEMRNAIAHGRKNVPVSIGLVFQIDAYVAKTMIAIRNSVFENYRLIL